jgi:hypothetical protein
MRMNIVKEVKMVLWGFIGLGDRDRTNPPKGRPLVLLGVAFVLLALFLGILVTVARLAASGG